MASEQYVDCELFLTSPTQARLAVAGRDYSGRPHLDHGLERRLLEVALEPVEYGSRLFQALFSGDSDDLLAGYRESLSIARHQSKRLRFRLHIADTAPPQLHALHWELLYDPGKKIAFSRSQETAFSRYLGVAFQPATAATGRPKLLVVLSSPTNLADYNLPSLERAALLQAMEKALAPLSQLVAYEILDGPATVERIRDRLVAGEFHALHLQAHGLLPQPQQAHGLLPQSRDLASLVLERDDGSAHCIDEELFGEVFEGQRNLRLVTLIACHGGAAAGKDLFSGLGPALVARGIPAVVAMRREISIPGATRFSEHFYRNLARSGQVDAAANEARLQMHLAEPSSLEWATPALFMRLVEGRLWSVESNTEGVATPPEPPDPEPMVDDEQAAYSTAVLKTLLVSDLVDSTKMAEDLGDERMAEIFRLHDRLARDLLLEHEGQEVDRTDGFLLLFGRPFNAVCYALDFHRAMLDLSQKVGVELAFRVGIHLGEVVLIRTPQKDIDRGAKPVEVEGLAKPTAARLMSLAQGGQTLLSATAFDLARRSAVGTASVDEGLRWIAHGEYRLKGVAAPIPVYEVGVKGLAPLTAPPDTEKVRRVADDKTILGWRPGIGLEVPQRRHWVLEKKLSQGGFGEVWLAGHEKLHQLRAFKFCFEAERLQALQREITLFRLLKEELGDRDDIARILDWNFEEAPYFIESEVATEGDLVEWADGQGGLGNIPMAQRLELVAQVATALAAAHSVGVLHKDVKPRNVLIAGGAEGQPRARLADFGIGMVTERNRLEAAGITVLGMSTGTGEGSSSHASSSYSGTRLYMAPELLEGKRATLQSDIYALGVVLYQSVVGDFTRALAPGWRRDVDDELIREDIAAAVDGSPERRLGNALRIAERLRSLESRRAEKEAQQQEREEAREAKAALARTRKRRKLVVLLITALALFGGTMTYLVSRIASEAERANHEAEVAQRVSKFMVDLFEVSDHAVARGDTITARELLDRAAAELPGELVEQPLVRAELMATIGTVYQRLGLYPSAAPLLEEALQIRQQLLDDHHPEVAKSLYQLAFLYRVQGRTAEAETLYLGSLMILQENPDAEIPELVDSLRGLGVVLYQQGRYDEATAKFQQALKVLQDLDNSGSPAMAMLFNNLALVDYVQGRYGAAASLYQRALEILEKTEGADSPLVATALENIGTTHSALEQYEEAERHYLRCLEIRRRILTPDHPDIARILNNLASLHNDRGRYQEAEKLFLEALEVKTKAYGREHQSVAIGLKNLADIYRSQGRTQEAETNYLAALKIFEKVLGPDHIYVAATLHDLGTLYGYLGRFSEAETSLQRALAIREASFEPTHPALQDTLKQYAMLKRAMGQETEAMELERRIDEEAPPE